MLLFTNPFLVDLARLIAEDKSAEIATWEFQFIDKANIIQSHRGRGAMYETETVQSGTIESH